MNKQQSNYWADRNKENHLNQPTSPTLTLPEPSPYEFTLNGMLTHLSNTRHNIERMVFAVGQQLGEMGLCDPMIFDNSHEQSDTYNALGRLGYEARQLDVQVEHLRQMADALLRQYPAQDKS